MGVFKKGENWYIDYYLKGRRKRKKVGPSKKLAEQVLRDVQVKLVKGEFLGVYEDRKVPFEEFVEHYRDYSRTNKSPSSHTRDLVSFRCLRTAFAGRYLFEISSQMIEEYKAGRIRAGVTPATVNRELSCLRHMFSKAIEWGHLKKNPAQGVRQLKEPPGRVRYLESEQIARLLKAIDALPRGCDEYLKPIVVLALNTGLRKGEILSLRWRDVNFEEKRITVLKTKNNEVRTVPMNEAVRRELEKLTPNPESEFVFCSRKGEPYGNVRRSFDRAVKAAGIEDFRFHDLRHTFASHLVMNGSDIRTVQQLMGHKDIKMTMRYSHLSRAHLQEAVDRLGSAWTLFGHQEGLKEEEAAAPKSLNAK